MQKTKIATYIFWAIVTILPIIGIILSLSDPQGFSVTQNIWRERIASFSVLAPLAFVLLQAFQVVITPMSHYSIGVLGGFLYGPYIGSLLNWIGRVIGHIIAFSIARFVGREVAKKFVSPETLAKYDKYVSNKTLLLFLFYFLPIFPDDEMSYMAGLSKMKFRYFLVANLFGHIGGSLALAYVGSGIDTKDPLFWILTLITIAGFPVLWYLMKREKQSPVVE